MDLLLKNVTLLTGNEVIRDGWLAVKADRIAGIGGMTAARPAAREELDLTGHVVTPGFVNTHTHSALTMVRGVAADLGFAPSYTKGIPNAASLSEDDAVALARLGAVEAMCFGSTLIGEHFVHIDACLPALARLGLRVHASLRLSDLDWKSALDGRLVYDAAVGDSLVSRNVDLFEKWNGKENGRIAVQFAAHAADTCSEALLARIGKEAESRAAIVNTHLGQSRTEVERVKARSGKTSAQVLADAGLMNERLLCGHCIYLEDSDIALMKKAGAHVVHIPKCNAASGRLAPTPKLVEAGLNLSLSTDTQHGDMVELMRWALTTARVQTGRVDDAWQPEHVFAMATSNGAKALGRPDLGTLKKDMKADFVVFDYRRPHLVPAQDPLGNLVHTAQGRDVAMVYVDGRCVARNGRPTLVDFDEVMADARRAIKNLWREAA